VAVGSRAPAFEERWLQPPRARPIGGLARLAEAVLRRIRPGSILAASAGERPSWPSARRGGRTRGALAATDRFEELYFRTAQRTLVFLTRRTADPEIAADLWGETWARAFEARDRYRGSSHAEEEGWLFGIARHVLAGYYKRGKAEQRALQRLGLERPLLGDGDLRELERLAGLNELRDVLDDVLRGLSADQRRALSLRIVRGLPYEDVAHLMGVSEETARARVSRGLRALGQALESSDVDLSALEST
jgi:RNA polymerase sigma-70 factor (ECF subfamily)